MEKCTQNKFNDEELKNEITDFLNGLATEDHVMPVFKSLLQDTTNV